MQPRFRDYVKHAFNARPIGMFVPPNWIGVGLFALLGLVNPGFWVMGLGEELRKSLAGQIEILQQRLEKRREARDKLVFLDAELTRLQEQVELIREQAVLSTDPEVLSDRIDQITATLGGTTQWIREQQQIYGAVEDLLAEPPALSPQLPARESQ